MKQFSDYVYFVYVGNNKRYGFSTYTNPTTGQATGYVVGHDEKGRPIYKKWSWNYDSQRQIRVHKDEKDLTGKLAVDFLRSSPECFNSPNGHIVDGQQVLAYFKELNEGKDADIALESRTLVLESQNAAMAIKDGQELVDTAAIIGLFDKAPSTLRLKVLDYASNYPKKFLETINDPTKNVRALINKAVNATVFSIEGKQIKWENKLIGADLDDAITTLLKDDKLRKAVELNLSKFGG